MSCRAMMDSRWARRGTQLVQLGPLEIRLPVRPEETSESVYRPARIKFLAMATWPMASSGPPTAPLPGGQLNSRLPSRVIVELACRNNRPHIWRSAELGAEIGGVFSFAGPPGAAGGANEIVPMTIIHGNEPGPRLALARALIDWRPI